jgi:hypothetical protein
MEGEPSLGGHRYKRKDHIKIGAISENEAISHTFGTFEVIQQI